MRKSNYYNFFQRNKQFWIQAIWFKSIISINFFSHGQHLVLLLKGYRDMFTVSNIIIQYPNNVVFFLNYKIHVVVLAEVLWIIEFLFSYLPTQSQLPLNFTSSINNGNWSGCAFVPASYFPPKVTKFNAYAIHGSGPGRVYEALYPASAEKHTDPDL